MQPAQSHGLQSQPLSVHTARSVDWSVAKPLSKPVCPTTTGMSQSTHTQFVARSVAVVLRLELSISRYLCNALDYLVDVCRSAIQLVSL